MSDATTTDWDWRGVFRNKIKENVDKMFSKHEWLTLFQVDKYYNKVLYIVTIAILPAFAS